MLQQTSVFRTLCSALLTLSAILLAITPLAESKSLLGSLRLQRISVDSSGSEGNGNSYCSRQKYESAPSVSEDGTKIVFTSEADNLVVGDTNSSCDIFVYDTATKTTTRVSVDSSGAEGDDDSFHPSISSDGSTVVFASEAENLVSNDSNGETDIFTYDLTSGKTELVSYKKKERTGRKIGADGSSLRPAVNSDGTKVAFVSYANNLVLSDEDIYSHVFVHNITTGSTTRVSVDSSGSAANSFSGRDGIGESYYLAISDDGSTVAFPSNATNLVTGDTNSRTDIFTHDTTTSTTTRVSIDSSGNEGDDESVRPSISGDGTVIAFDSDAGNLVSDDSNGTRDVFLHDTSTGTTKRISVNPDTGAEDTQGSGYPDISEDGSTVTFSSEARTLLPTWSDLGNEIYIYTEASDTTVDLLSTRQTRTGEFKDSNGNNLTPGISSDGTKVAFLSVADNLTVSGSDTNGVYDVFTATGW